MDATHNPEPVAALLAQYPGPVRLPPSKGLWFGFTLAGAFFTGTGVYVIVKSGGSDAVWGWIGAVFFGLCFVCSIAVMLFGLSELILDQDGFATRLGRAETTGNGPTSATSLSCRTNSCRSSNGSASITKDRSGDTGSGCWTAPTSRSNGVRGVCLKLTVSARRIACAVVAMAAARAFLAEALIPVPA
jgi:hypothetical protein